MKHHNIFSGLPADLPSELVTPLLEGGNVRIERIVSRGHASPEDSWYDQETAEWVIVLRGRARLVFEDGSREVEMGVGDYVHIRPHERHRVAWTDPDGDTVWLAVHLGPGK